jgi:hypothetical protein
LGGSAVRRRATVEDAGLEHGESPVEGSEVQNGERKDSKEKTLKELEAEETSTGNDRRHAETFKEQAGPAVEQRSQTQQARVPMRKRGGWRDELRYL